MPFLREWTVTSPSKLDPSPPLPCISGLLDRICFCNTFRFLWVSFQIQSSLCFNYKHCVMHVLSETHYWGRRPSDGFPTSTGGWISSLPVSWALWGCCWHLGRAANVPQTPWTEVFVHSLFRAQSTLAHEKLASAEVVLVGIASKLRWLRRTSGEEQHVSPFSRIAAGRNQLVVQAQAVLASWREHRAAGARYVTAVFLLIHLQQELCAKPEHVGRGSLEEEIFQSRTEKAFSPLVYRLWSHLLKRLYLLPTQAGYPISFRVHAKQEWDILLRHLQEIIS